MCDPIRSSAAGLSPLLPDQVRQLGPGAVREARRLAPSSPRDLNFWPPWGPLAGAAQTMMNQLAFPGSPRGAGFLLGQDGEGSPGSPGFAAAASLALSRSAAVLGSPLDAGDEGWGDPVVAGSPVDAGGWACGWDFRGRHDRLSL